MRPYWGLSEETSPFFVRKNYGIVFYSVVPALIAAVFEESFWFGNFYGSEDSKNFLNKNSNIRKVSKI
jgi:hypothetical protein